jgi:hypothetical protein
MKPVWFFVLEQDSDSGDSGDEILENLFGQDIDADEIFGHLFLTSDLHNIPADYPEHYFGAAKLMSRKDCSEV